MCFDAHFPLKTPDLFKKIVFWKKHRYN